MTIWDTFHVGYVAKVYRFFNKKYSFMYLAKLRKLYIFNQIFIWIPGTGSISTALSEKGKKQFLVGGFKFSYQKTLKGDIKRWICISSKATRCKAHLKTEGPADTIVAVIANHNHDPIPQSVLIRRALGNSAKQAAVHRSLPS